EIVGNLVDRSRIRSDEIDDFLYMVVDQVMNYYLVSLSPGHKIVSKYSGRISGERIAKQAKIQGLKNALDYLTDLFLYLKAGIINWEEGSDRIVIKMQESVYASGVKNINMELCIFLAGIMEGILNVSTGEKWDVNERKCIATGFPECEFHAKTLRQRV
ncbi:MAG: V4R domain-containing protein, partial [Candidatus Aenigmatarchaeota archaeon]